MSSVNIDLAADTILNVMVGQQDENEVREVVFDFSDWYTTYGSGTISLAIQRPKDEWPYEGTLTVDNSTHKATWEISDTDSAYAGVGQIQLSYTVGTAVKKSVVYRFTVHKSLGALGSVITPIQIQTFIDEVTEALEDMQEELNDVKQDLQNAGMSEDFKQALHNILEKASFEYGDGKDYLDALDNAMWPPANLLSISAVFTQGDNVIYDTDSLDTLKQYLVVTAHYSDNTSETITTYALSGTLEEGTSTITVTYNRKTTTFDVTVSYYWDYSWEATSLEAPPNMTFGYAGSSYNSTEEAYDAIDAVLDFNYLGNAKMEIVAKFNDVLLGGGNEPQFILKTGAKAGFKIYPNNDPLIIRSNASGTASNILEMNENGYHTYLLMISDGVCSVTIDGTLIDSGPGVTNNNYLANTGIYSTGNTPTARMFVKSIKFREL